MAGKQGNLTEICDIPQRRLNHKSAGVTSTLIMWRYIMRVKGSAKKTSPEETQAKKVKVNERWGKTRETVGQSSDWLVYKPDIFFFFLQYVVCELWMLIRQLTV